MFSETSSVAPQRFAQISFCSYLSFCCFYRRFKRFSEPFIFSDFSVSAAKVHQRPDSLHFPPAPSGGISVLPSSLPSLCPGLGAAGSSGKPVARSGCWPLALDARRCWGPLRGPTRGRWFPSRSHERWGPSPHQKPHPSSPPK